MLTVAWVYILTNKNDTVLYIGSTIDLPTRLWEHRTKQNPKCFTAGYNVHKRIYYEPFNSIEEARARETFMKRKTRKWKENLIASMNDNWDDLSDKFNVHVMQ